MNNGTKISIYLFVAGEKMQLDRSSNPGPFADCANTVPLSFRAIWSWFTNNFSTGYIHIKKKQKINCLVNFHIFTCGYNIFFGLTEDP